MSLPTILGLFVITGGATTLGSLPVIFHKYIKANHWGWWESFGGGVMVSASLFSLFLPAVKLGSLYQVSAGIVLGICFIFFMTFIIQKLTENVLHQRAFLYVFVMALHNIPEGLAVGVDVAALGWRASLPLTVAIFIQNLPEGLTSAMSFLLSGFALKKALLANGVTAVIETLSAFLGYAFIHDAKINLPFLLSFAGACMISVVGREIFLKIDQKETHAVSVPGFLAGVTLCGLLDLTL
jgi:ZIP family zinc transporter